MSYDVFLELTHMADIIWMELINGITNFVDLKMHFGAEHSIIEKTHLR